MAYSVQREQRIGSDFSSLIIEKCSAATPCCLITLLTHLEKQLLSINNDKIESKFKDRNEINYEAAGTYQLCLSFLFMIHS